MATVTTHTRFGISGGKIADRYQRIRSTTLRICDRLSAEDMVVQACTETSPTKWHLAHTTWFFETFILEAYEHDFTPYNDAFRVLFNSYYQQVGDRHPRHQRGMLTRPGLGEVLAYRDTTDERIAVLLDNADPQTLARIAPLIELGLNHEQQHQELILMDIKRLLHLNPLQPAYTMGPPPSRDRLSRTDGGGRNHSPWQRIDGGLVEIGDIGDRGFTYDNEGPRHRRYINPFELATRLVTNAEYARFIEAGGYREPNHWLEPGWAKVCEEGWRCPLYWRRDSDGEWTEFTLHGRRALNPDAPAVHLSFFEADAYAKWRGARLPTEAEWEAAAMPRWEEASAEGNFLDNGLLTTRAAEGHHAACDIAQLGGDAWEWTRSAHEPYPGYAPPEGAIGEYNGKFMCGSFVLRGGSCVTPRDHVRLTYRNFFSPDSRWAFSGIRLARDTKPSRRVPSRNGSTATQASGRNLRPKISGAADEQTLAQDVAEGFGGSGHIKAIAPRHLYDAIGGELFEEICEVDAYYLPRVEREIMGRLPGELSRRLGRSATVIEPGAGDGSKAERLLAGLDRPRMYVPIEVNADALARCGHRIAERFPLMCVQPIRAAFREGLDSLYGVPATNRLLFFPGSSIGNMQRGDRIRLLKSFGETMGEQGHALVGFDLVKDPAVMIRAYDDPEGASARFGLNLIARLNRELDAGLDPDAFVYGAVWDRGNSRIEMYLTCTAEQWMSVMGTEIVIGEGERIVTEYSHKFTPAMIHQEAAAAGLEIGETETWCDENEAYAVCLLTRNSHA
ncbi:MAG: ergothioneine biosynthesis protein EgtB [Phycisphaerales bacterium]